MLLWFLITITLLILLLPFRYSRFATPASILPLRYSRFLFLQVKISMTDIQKISMTDIQKISMTDIQKISMTDIHKTKIH